MPNDGYVSSNGIYLCPECHIKAEKYHSSKGKEYISGFHPNNLYSLIGSSYDKAYKDSNNTKSIDITTTIKI